MNKYASQLLPPIKQNSTRGACKKCGYAGHLTYQRRNFIKVDPNKEVVSSTSSESDQDYLTPLTELCEKELKEKLKKLKKKKKHKKSSEKRKQKTSSSEDSEDSDNGARDRKHIKTTHKNSNKKYRKSKYSSSVSV